MIGTPDLYSSPSTPKKEDRELLITSDLSPCARAELNHLDQFSDAKMLVIEGNIGVGKTTLARGLAKRLGYKAFLEPALENPFLERFYADPHKYALKLQLWIFRQRYQTFLQAVKHMRATGEGAILDRSIFSDYVFASVGHSQGFISKEGFMIYEKLRCQTLQCLPRPHYILYLEAAPQVCAERLQKRGRDCESSIPLDYLESLQTEYHSLLHIMQSKGSSVLRQDWSEFGSPLEVLNQMAACHCSISWNKADYERVCVTEQQVESALNQAVQDECNTRED